MKKRLVLLFGIIFLIISEFSFILATPTQIATCRNTDCFLTIPRHKIFQSQTNPNEIWLIFPGPGTGRYDNFMKTNDGGATWNTPITIKAYLDYHSSLDGDSAGNLYLADSYSGGAYFRKINYPGSSISDLGPEMPLTSAYLPLGVSTMSNVIAQDTSSIFVFSRTSVNVAGNVRYFHSTDGGITFPEEGWVNDTGYENVRIGSLLIEGMPAVVIWYSDDSSSTGWGYKYFIWNGTQFVQKPDSTIIWSSSKTYLRRYAMSYVNGEFHVIYPAGNNLYDSWKTYNNGVGTWTQTIIEYNPVSGSDWSPQLTRYGNELYLFYLRVVGIDMNNIFYRKWNSSSQTWSSATQLTFDNNNVRYPQGPAIVPVSSSVIPLAWSKDATIWYDSIPVSGTPTVSLDVNSDGKINIIDLAITTFWQGKNNGQGDWNLFQHIDLDSDGKVSFTDVLRVITGM